jgi:hypothetical protein
MAMQSIIGIMEIDMKDIGKKDLEMVKVNK